MTRRGAIDAEFSHPRGLDSTVEDWLHPRRVALWLLSGEMHERGYQQQAARILSTAACCRCGTIVEPGGARACTGLSDLDMNIGAYVEAGCRALTEP